MISDAVWIAIIIASAVIVIVVLLLILKLLRPKNDYKADVHGGVDLNNGIYGITGEAYGKKGYHTGTLVIRNSSNRIKVTIFDAYAGTEAVFNIERELIIRRGTTFDRTNPDVYIITNDSMVSAPHCKLVNYAGKLAVEDMNSTNHTYLNGLLVTTLTYVESGDELAIGNTRLIISY